MRIENLEHKFEAFRFGSINQPEFKLGPINLEVEQGYIVGVIGRNGSGKSTLFENLLGVNIEHCPAVEDKSKVAYVLEKCPFLKDYTPKDIAYCYSSFYKDFDYKKYEGLCKRYNIPMKKPLKKLSRGMVMMVQIAFAFSYKSEILILDEATAHLDSMARKELYAMVSEYVEQGGLVFWATHIMEELDRMADYVLGLDKGQQVLFEEKDRLLDKYSRVKGTAQQLNYISKALIGRKDHETFSEGILDNSKEHLPVNVQIEAARLEDIVEYVL